MCTHLRSIITDEGHGKEMLLFTLDSDGSDVEAPILVRIDLGERAVTR